MSDDLEVMKMYGFDDCIIGIVERHGMGPVLCYDTEKVVAKLMKGGLSEEDAREFFLYNQLGAWVGDGTPCFLMVKDWQAFLEAFSLTEQLELFQPDGGKA